MQRLLDVNKSVYLIGGYDGKQTLTSVLCYEDDSDSWQPYVNLTFGGSNLVAFADSSKIHIVGGQQCREGGSGDDFSTESIDLTSDQIIPGIVSPDPFLCDKGCIVYNDKDSNNKNGLSIVADMYTRIN